MKKALPVIALVLMAGQLLHAQTVKLNADAFEKKMAATDKKIILDVRTIEEFSQGHLVGAVDIDFYKTDFKERLGKLDKSKPVFVYCLAGGRSNSAAKMMSDMGFLTVYDLDGGYRSWSSAGKAVVK